MNNNDVKSLSHSQWNCKDYYTDTAGESENCIAEYIKHQLENKRSGE